MIKRVPSKQGNQKGVLYLIQSLKDSIGERTDEIVRVSVNGISGGGSSGPGGGDHTTLANLNGGTYLDGGHTYLVPVHQEAADPDANDDVDNYKVGTIWINTSSGDAFICSDNTNAAAVWNTVGGSGSSLDLEVNGTPNVDQTLLNLIDGTDITITDNGDGSVTIDYTGSAVNYWDRTGTVLHPLTAGDTLQVGDGTTSQVAYGFENEANSGLGYLDDTFGSDFPTLVALGELVLTYGSAGSVWDIAQTGMSFAWWSANVGGTSPQGLLLIDGNNDRVHVGAGDDGGTTHAASRFSVLKSNTHPTDALVTLDYRQDTTGSGIGRDIDHLFSYTQVGGGMSKVLTNDHFYSEIEYIGGTGEVLSSSVAYHKVLLTASLGATSVVATDWRYQQFSRDNGSGEFGVWNVHRTGLHENRYNGVATITGAPAGVAVTFAEAVPDTGYSIMLTGGWTAYTVQNISMAVVGSGWIYTKAVTDDSAKGTAGFPIYGEFQLVDGATFKEYDATVSTTVLSTAILANYKGVGGVLLAFTDADYTQVQWAVRRY